MKNKGFTLIELLLTIAIIGVLSVTTGLSITNMMKRQDENKYNDYIEDLENAACVYAQQVSSCKNGCTITPNDLVNHGLMRKNVKNPKENIDITADKGTIKISFVSGERKCVYKEGKYE